jgi:uncharacterized protein (UPF0276 family)
MKLGVPMSPATLSLAQAGKLDVDYIVYYGQAGMKWLHDFAQYKPIYIHDLPEPFWLNYENPFLDEVMRVGREMLDVAEPPWFSTGIGASAEPQAHRDGPYREGNDEDLQSRETVIKNIVKHGRRLKAWLGMPLLLENFNYHPTNAYEYICEPELFTQLLDEIDCGMLLDLAHARISAHNMGWASAESYLEAMPLHKVREIHVTRPGWQGDQRVDLHQPLQDDDFPLLGWVLDHTATESVTIEVDTDITETELVDQIDRMRQFLTRESA